MSVYVNGNLQQERAVIDEIYIGADPTDGIKFEGEYGWRDLIGLIKPDLYKDNSPDLSVFMGAIREYSYSLDAMIDCVYHVPHDYALGTDLFIHTHWGHNGTGITGDNDVKFTYTYAKRTYDPMTPFISAETQTMTVSTNIVDFPQYCHAVNEIQLSSSTGASGLLNTADIEIDGLILVNVEQIGIPTISGTDVTDPFIFTVDIHYQSTGISSKNSAPNYYI